VDGFGRYTTLGRTIDDAAGEAFDKSGKIMGLEYPAGAKIDVLAQGGDPAAVHLPRPMIHDGTLKFSFSGLKTALMQHVAKHPVSIPGQAASDLCASFQQAVCDVLESKTRAALEQTGAVRLVVAGGVACNSGLRSTMARLAREQGIELHIPRASLCGDNAAMLAVAGNYYLEQGLASAPDLDVTANWEMDRIKEIFCE
jgi:N6-L-threonylcarbamoyladenine synthase